MPDPIRVSDITDAVALASARATAKVDAATVRRVNEENPSDPVVALEDSVQGREETNKLRVTVTVTPLVEAVEDKEVASRPEDEVARYEEGRARREAEADES